MHDTYRKGDSMNIEFMRSGKVSSVEELSKKLDAVVEQLNQTREAPCWICQEIVMNWGVLILENPEMVGLGAKPSESGRENVRIAYFPFCPEHDINSEESNRCIRKKLSQMRQEFSN
jgi:hypothetical protein